MLDPDDEIGVGEADAIAGGRAVVIGVGAAIDLHVARHSRVTKRVDCLQRRVADRLVVERPLDEPVEPDDLARAAERDELDLARVARLEADGRAGGDVQPHAVRRRAIEGQPAVHLEEMAVRSDLHRPIAAVGDLDAPRRTPGVDLDRLGREEDIHLESSMTALTSCSPGARRTHEHEHRAARVARRPAPAGGSRPRRTPGTRAADVPRVFLLSSGRGGRIPATCDASSPQRALGRAPVENVRIRYPAVWLA